MGDAMPREFVRPFRRYLCPATVLLVAYLYCNNKFLNAETFATRDVGRLWAWHVSDRSGREHEILSSGSLYLTTAIHPSDVAACGWSANTHSRSPSSTLSSDECAA